MACCGKGCEKRREALLDPAILGTAAEQGAFIISKLLEIAATGGGLLYMFKDNPRLNELAATINLLASENQYLKKLLARDTAPEVAASAKQLAITFGPEQQYTLTIPIGAGPDRARMAEQLREAAAALAPKAAQILPSQKIFSFLAD
jgi:hypothetical protein